MKCFGNLTNIEVKPVLGNCTSTTCFHTEICTNYEICIQQRLIIVSAIDKAFLSPGCPYSFERKSFPDLADEQANQNLPFEMSEADF